VKHFWKARIIKHHLNTGDIRNHIEIVGIEKIDSEPDIDLYVYEVTAHFVESEEQDYVYEVETDNPDLDPGEAMELVIDQIGI
jgi:hypothetical protein